MNNQVMNVENGGNQVAQVANNGFSMSLQELKQRASMVSQIKSQIMLPNVHFGKIPGCGDKPTLLKNGAEMLCMAFRLASDTKIEISDLGNGHREYTVTTMLMSNGELVATGVGSCSTMESKYRYRGNELELVGDCPQDYWSKPKPSKYNGHTAKKDENGKWKLFKKGAKTENPDIADVYNTVLKMASKRSLIDATLKATGGSCEFTQDIEDNPQAFGASQSTYEPEYTVMDEQPAPQQSQPQQASQASPHHSRGSSFRQELNAMRAIDPNAFERVKARMNAEGWNVPLDVPEDRRHEIKQWFDEEVQKGEAQEI